MFRFFPKNLFSHHFSSERGSEFRLNINSLGRVCLLCFFKIISTKKKSLEFSILYIYSSKNNKINYAHEKLMILIFLFKKKTIVLFLILRKQFKPFIHLYKLFKNMSNLQYKKYYFIQYMTYIKIDRPLVCFIIVQNNVSFVLFSLLQGLSRLNMYSFTL